MPLSSRRRFLTWAAAAGAGVGTAPPRWPAASAADTVTPRSVAAVVTVYYPNSHADVILGKILEGWKQDKGRGPALRLASLYVDQFPDEDLARDMCRQHQVPLFDTVRGAVTVGGTGLPVDGVLCIGEHGDYPYNDKGQHLYPRRRLFGEILATFEERGRVVPVFHDKHPGPVWSDAVWMHRRAQELGMPWMAGSSLPVGFRLNPIDVPLGTDLEAAVGIGYSGLDIYGIHALEFYQYYVERRRNAEQGVRSVQFLRGDAMWKAVDQGVVSRAALQAAFEVVPKPAAADMRRDPQAGLFLFEYRDGFQGAVFMLSCVQGVAIGLQVRGQPRPWAAAADERAEPRYPHFAYLLKAIEQMVHTGRPAYPVERTMLTCGVLDRALTSRAQDDRRLETPELAIAYEPVDYPHAPQPDLTAPPSARR